MTTKTIAVMLCAGKSTRTWPLTENRPKPLLPFFESTIIEHNLDQLQGIITKAIIIVGYKKEMIQDTLGNSYKGIELEYLYQERQLGTGHAVLLTKSLLEKQHSFIIMNGDDLYSKKDIIQLINYGKPAILAKIVKNPSAYGIFTIDQNDFAIDLQEKPKEYIGNLANSGCYYVTASIFNFLEKVIPSERNEIELTSAVTEYIQTQDRLKIIPIISYWLPISYPWSYLEAHVYMLNNVLLNNSQETLSKHDPSVNTILGTCEIGSHITGNLFLGKNSIIKPGTVIEGPVWIGENCIIGPHAYIRPNTIIMNNCTIRAEIFDSIIMKGVTAKHSSYIGHSVVGEFTNIAAGTITADYRHDSKEHTTLIQGNKIITGRKKLGAFIGDNVKTGIGTLLYPGRKIQSGAHTMPGQIVDKDIFIP